MLKTCFDQRRWLNVPVLSCVLAAFLFASAPLASAQTLNDILRIIIPPATQPPAPVHRPGGYYPPPPTSPSPGTYSSPPQRQPSTRPSSSGYVTRSQVMEVQRMLNDLGYDAGPVDGVAGRRTRDALNAFRRNNGLATTSGIDQRSLAALRSIHAGTSARGELGRTPPVHYARTETPLAQSPRGSNSAMVGQPPQHSSPPQPSSSPRQPSSPRQSSPPEQPSQYGGREDVGTGDMGAGRAPRAMPRARPSFECDRAQSATEQAICGDTALALLDSRLASMYADARSKGDPQTVAALTVQQRHWLEERNECGAGRACLLNEYVKRINALKTSAKGQTSTVMGSTYSDSAARGGTVYVSQPTAHQLQPIESTQQTAASPPIESTQLTDLRQLANLPPWLQSIDFEYHQGLPVATPTTTLHILSLMGMADGAPTSNECTLFRRVLFTKEALRGYMDVQDPRGCWAGKDEFQIKDARRAFYEQYSEPLRQLAPRAPFRMVFVAPNSLGQFNAATGGFRLKDPLLKAFDQSFKINSPYYPLQMAPMKWPDAMLPADEARARELLEIIRVQTEADASLKTPFYPRLVQVVGVFDVLGVDFEAERIDINLVSLRLYDPAFTQVLHEFELPPRFDTFVRGDIPDRLNIPRPVPLNSLFLLSHYVAHEPENSTKGWEALYSRIVDRDKKFYSAMPTDALAHDDPRLPLFIPRPQKYSQAVQPQLKKWAAAYRAGASEVMEWDYGDFPRGPRTMYGSVLFDVPSKGSVDRVKPYLDILEAEDIQPEQVGVLARDGITTLVIAPNRLDLYGLEFPKGQVDSHNLTPRALFVRNQVKTSTDSQGNMVLVVYIEPIRLAAYQGERLIAQRTYEEIPRLDGSFVADQVLSRHSEREEAVAAGDAILDISPAALDMIVLKGLGDRAPNDVVQSMVARRWKLENSKAPPAGAPFFVKGMREPQSNELPLIAPDFRDWVDAALPALPITLRIATLTHPRREQWLSWDALTCSGPQEARLDGRHTVTRTPQEMADFNQMRQYDADAKTRLGHAYRSMELQRATYRTTKEQGQPHSWTNEREQETVQLGLAVALSDRIQRLGDICGLPSEGLPTVFIEMQDSLPFTGKNAVSAEVLIEVTGVRMADTHPHYSDWLWPEIVEDQKLKPPVSLAGEAIVIEARLKEAVYRDKLEREVARVEPDPASTREMMTTEFQALVAKQDAEAAQIAEKTRMLDLVGVRLGMDMAEAEQLIREHMDVGRVLVGKRLHDGSFDEGRLAPATSGKMFISRDGTEVIGIYDEPPSQANKVLIVWRRVYLEAGSVELRDIDAVLRQKYGDPAYESNPMANVLYKWRMAGNDVCLNNHGGQRNHAISLNWRELGGEPAEVVFDGQPMPDSQLPSALFDPEHQTYSRSLNCGPVVSAYLDFQGSRQMDSYGRRSKHVIEMYLTDIDTYLAAFRRNREASKAKLAENTAVDEAPSVGGLKF